MKLWILPMSVSMVTFSFFTYTLSFNVCSCVIPIIEKKDILGISSSCFLFGTSFYSLHSFKSLIDVIDSFSTSQLYNYLLLHLFLGDHLSSQYLHFFNHLLSRPSSIKGGGTYLLYLST
jgi:hypothetical protein